MVKGGEHFPPSREALRVRGVSVVLEPGVPFPPSRLGDGSDISGHATRLVRVPRGFRTTSAEGTLKLMTGLCRQVLIAAAVSALDSHARDTPHDVAPSLASDRPLLAGTAPSSRRSQDQIVPFPCF